MFFIHRLHDLILFSMFQVTISFRCNDEKLRDEKGMIIIAGSIIYNMRSNLSNFYRKIEEFVRPMTQREAGLHLNLDKCGTDLEELASIFGTDENCHKDTCTRIRYIADNFWKLDFICINASPFRICSETSQDMPRGMLGRSRFEFDTANHNFLYMR